MPVASRRFELEQVLKYRTEIERTRKQEFSVAKQNFEHACERLNHEQAKLEGLSKEFCNRQAELNSIEDLRMYSDFFGRKREEIKDHKEQVDQLEHVVSDRREILLDASKEKKVLETLKDKNEKEFRLAMDKKEQEFMDEIAIQKKEDPSE